MEQIDLDISVQHLRLHLVFCLLFLTAGTLKAQLTTVPQWTERLGGSGADRPRDFILDAAGNVYTSGYFTGTVDFDPGPGVSNLTSSTGSNSAFVTKMDASGNFIWARTLAGAGSSGQGIAVDATGNVYVVGGFLGTADFDPGPAVFNMTAATTGQHDIYIVKLDANGNFQWAKGIIGGTWWDNPYRIVVDPSGNVVIVGRVYYQGGARDFDPGPATYMLTIGWEDIFVLKLDTNGNFVWAKLMGGVEEDRGYSIAADAAGNIYTTGYFEKTADLDPGPGTFNLTSSGDWDVFISKLDANGNFVWAKAMVNSSATYYNDGSYGTKIALDPSGNVYTSGRFNGTVDFDPGAGVVNLTAVGGYDIYVSKLTTDGDFVWAKSMGGSGYDEGFSLDVDLSGDVYVSGFFAQTVDFDPGAGIVNKTSVGGDDIFACKLDKDGNFKWVTSMGGTGADQGAGIAVNTAGDVYVAGWFNGTVDFDPGACSYNLTSAGADDVFIQKLRQTTVLPPPTISAFTPDNGAIGASITISGTNFSTVPAENGVAFFNNKTAVVTASTATSITVDVPFGATAGPISVTVRCLTVTSTQSFCVASPTPPTVGLIAYYPFTGNANDQSGNNNNGTNNGATLTTDRFGNANSAYLFNGTSSYISVPSSASLTSPTTAITMNAWVNLAGLSLVGQNFGPIFTKSNSSGNAFMYAFAVELNGAAFSTGLNNWTNYIETPYSFSYNQWYMLTTVLDNTTASFYLDGALLATYPFSVSIANNTLPLEIGRDSPGLAEIFNGKIDDIRIYNRGLTACEVSELYAAPNPGGPTITSFVAASGPVGTTVTITGTNFSTTPADNTVTFNGTNAIVTASTATSITTTVPPDATTGPITVTVSSSTAISATDFTVTVPTAITISAQPLAATVCDGTAVTFAVAATGTTNIIYQWQFATNSNPSTFTDIINGGGYSNVTTATLSVNTTGPFGAGHYRCKISGDLAPDVFSNDAGLTLTGSCSPVITAQDLATLVGGSITLDLLPLISAPNGNLDINSINATTPSSGATATVTDGLLTIFYAGISFSGTENITITACDLDGNCTEQLFSIEVAGDIIVYNGVSPGGANPTFVIQFIELLPDTKNNRVTIFDRWQNLVWQGSNYDNSSVVFSGSSDKGSELPAGTYYYRIEFDGGRKAQTGFISLKR